MNPREKPRIDLSRLKNILLIRLRRIGDVVMTTPAVTVLKTHLPQASISYLVEEPYRQLVEGNPLLDEVIVVPRKQRRGDFIRLIKNIRSRRFDCLIDFHGGPRASWLTLLSGAKLKVGYRIQHKGFLYGLNVPRSPEEGHIHSVENHANLIRALGVGFDSIPPLFVPEANEAEKERMSALISKWVGKDTAVAVLHLGAGNVFRDWGAGNLSRLIDLIIQRTKIRILLAGGPEDAERAEALAQDRQGEVLSLAGKLGLRELRELILRARLFIGTDSGPMHIAASTGTPIVALFGPTLPAHFRPWRAEARVIEKDFDCRSSCRQRECVHKDFRCLQAITADEVFVKCAEFL